MAESGVFVDDRAGFVLLNADSADELFELIAGLHDVAKIEAHRLCCRLVEAVEESGRAAHVWNNADDIIRIVFRNFT